MGCARVSAVVLGRRRVGVALAVVLLALGLPVVVTGLRARDAAALGVNAGVVTNLSGVPSAADWNADISSSGRYLAFASGASDLVAGDTNGLADGFVRDIDIGTTQRVSLDAAGNEMTSGSVWSPRISADGRYVVFVSNSALATSPPHPGANVFVRDLQTGTLQRVSDVCGFENHPTNVVDISADGRYVVWEGEDDFPCTGTLSIWMYDRSTSTKTKLVYAFSDSPAFAPTISDDGRWIVYARKLNGVFQVYEMDRTTLQTQVVSVDNSGNPGNASSRTDYPSAVSSDGRYVAFTSSASNLGAPANSVFVHDRVANTTTGYPVPVDGYPGFAYIRSMSSDGGRIVFSRDAPPDYFVLYRASGHMTRIPRTPLPGDLCGCAEEQGRNYAAPVISGDGSNVAFMIDDQYQAGSSVLSFARTSVPAYSGAAAVLVSQTLGTPGVGELAVNPTGSRAEPVNTATGAYFSSMTDLAMPGIGLPFAFTRHYNSNDSSSGRLGAGWTDDYNWSLTVLGTGDVTVRAGDGQQLAFAHQTDGSFVAAAGGRATLAAVAGGYELTSSAQVRYEFDSTGRLTAMLDRNSRQLLFAYNGSGQLTTITDTVGRVVTVTYNGAGLLSDVALPDGRHVSYGYTGAQLTSVTDTRSGTITYAYDGSGRLADVFDQNTHRVVHNVYGTDGRVQSQIDALNHTTTFAWDANTQTSTMTDARSNAWKDVYADNVLVQQIDPLGRATSFMYDTDLNVATVTDGRGNTTTMTYDARGNMLTRTAPAPLSYQQSWAWNARNNPTSYTDGRGKVTTYGYDGAGNLITITRPGTTVTTLTLDPTGTGLVTAVTDPRGKTTSYQYDTKGNRTQVTTPTSDVTTFGYDPTGRMTSMVEARGNAAGGLPSDYTWTYGYDNADHLTSVTDPLSHATSYAYDPVGNRTGVTDANSHTTTSSYDNGNRLTTVTAPGSATTTYGYDEVGDLTSRTDANNHATTWVYDMAMQPTSMTNPIGTWGYAYDANGNLTTVTPPGGGTVTSSYDTLNRLTGVDYSDTTPDVTYAYDGDGNRTSMTDSQGSVAYAYDDLNRVTSVTRGSSAFGYTYDPNGDVLTRTYPDTTVTTYTYDNSSRMATVVTGGQTTTYGYDPASHLVTRTLPAGNGYVETRTYDRAGQLTEVKNAKSGVVLSKTTATLDPVGNPLAEVNASGSTTTYTYDNRDRLTKACYATTTCTGATDFVGYSYDPVGNRLTETRPAGATSYTYNPSDQLTAQSGVNGASTFTYDARGNQTGGNNRTISYNLADRATQVTTTGAAQAYSPLVLADTPLAYWRLGEASGTSATDASGNAKTGTYTNAPTLNQTSLLTGDTNKAVSFDGTNDYVAIPSLGIFSSSFTIEAWVKPSTSPPSDEAIFGAHNTNATGKSLSLDVLSTGVVRLSYYSSDLSTPSGTVTFGQTAHIVATYDLASDTSKIYVNGVLKATGSQGPFNPASATFAVGRYQSAATRYFKGLIDEVAIYPAALTQYQVTNHYRSGTAQGAQATYTYAYDGDGIRAQSTLVGGSLAQATSYLWDPTLPYQQVAVEKDGTGAELRRYAYGAERISLTTGAGATSYYQYDRLGSVINMASATGVTQWTYTYDPYGNARSTTKNDSTAPTNTYRFAGETGDPTGLVQLRARQYDPGLGRLTAIDPLPDLIDGSRYGYANGNPVTRTDSSGLTPDDVGGRVSMAGLGACKVDPGASTHDYLLGKACPPLALGYDPVLVHFPYGDRVVNPHGSCSTPGPDVNEPLGSGNFLGPCQMHDYGYDLLRAGVGDRNAIDRQLLADMTSECRESGIAKFPACMFFAGVYYAAVAINPLTPDHDSTLVLAW